MLSAPAMAAQQIRIIVYGDSLTSGYLLQPEDAYPSRLKTKLRDMGYINIDVLNMSVAGETTAGGLERISSLLVKQPDIVVLELGGNDVIRGINPELIYRNLTHMITRLLENQVYIVLLGIKAPPNMGNTYMQQVDSIYHRLASHYKLAFYPFALQGIYGKPELNLADGYHPNSKGVDVMVENTYRYVDAGLRWKWSMQQYKERYQHQRDQDTRGAAAGPAVSMPGNSMQHYNPLPRPADPNAAMPPRP